jgi:hypothetical protein
MIDSATGMKPGERYAVESLERAHQFQGFFLDGKYYLDSELLTAVGWLEGQQFLYDDLDAAGSPVFPDGVAGVVEDLTLKMADGVLLPLTKIHVTVPNEAANEDGQEQSSSSSPPSTANSRWRDAKPGQRLLVLTAAAVMGGYVAALLGSKAR